MRRSCPTKCAALAALFVALPGAALARCAPFDLLTQMETVPIIIHGQVTRSNGTELSTATCSPECTHNFEVEVWEVLKGDANITNITVEYAYVPQRPAIDLFVTGDEWVFAISGITADGQATLFGTSCGRSGTAGENVALIRGG